MSKLKIGIVGCGAIGNSLAKAIVRRFSQEAELSALYDLDIIRAGKLSRLVSKRNNSAVSLRAPKGRSNPIEIPRFTRNDTLCQIASSQKTLLAMTKHDSWKNSLAVDDLGKLIDKSELVIECASSLASWGIAKKVLARSRDIMVMSAGGLVSHFRQLSSLAKRYNCKVYIPSGAICGIDALKAAKIGKIKRVVLITRKNPLSFRGVQFIKDKKIDLKKIRKDRVLFSGSASAAVKYFPQNINVAAVLSMAGIGKDRTLVKIIASPSVKRNIHEIQIESGAARIWTRTENVLHPDNPKTSFLSVLSAIAVLEQILEPVKIGT